MATLFIIWLESIEFCIYIYLGFFYYNRYFTSSLSIPSLCCRSRLSSGLQPVPYVFSAGWSHSPTSSKNISSKMCESLSESLLTTLAELVAVNWQVSFQCRSSVFLTVALPLHAKQGQWTCLYIFSLQSQPEISSLDQGTFTPSGIVAHKAKETRNIVRKFCLHEPPCFF